MESVMILLIIFVVTVCEVLLFRNVMMNYKECSGYKILLLILFSVITVLCAIAVITEGSSLYENTKVLNSNSIITEEIASLKFEISSEKRSIIIASIIGLTSFLISILVSMFIKKEWKRQLAKPMKKWDLNNMK